MNVCVEIKLSEFKIAVKFSARWNLRNTGTDVRQFFIPYVPFNSSYLLVAMANMQHDHCEAVITAMFL